MKNTDNLNKMVEVIQDQRLLKDETIFTLKFKEDSKEDLEENSEKNSGEDANFYEHNPGMEDDESSKTTLTDFFNHSDSAEIIYTGLNCGLWGFRKSPDVFIGNATNETLVIKIGYKAVNKVASR